MPRLNYLQFVKANPAILAFGFLTMFCGNFGQTFFLSLFNGAIQAELGLSHTQLSGTYSLATLASGFTLIWLGPKLDTTALKRFVFWVGLGLVTACLLLAFSTTLWMLGIAYFSVRLAGQGLMPHTAITSMAKLFDRNRGKAVALAAMGMPLGEILMPASAVFLVANFGWQDSWLLIAGSVVVLLLFLQWLLSKSDRQMKAGVEGEKGDVVSTEHDWTRAQVVRDWRFWLIIPAVITPAFVITGIFFHQIALMDSKGWSLPWLATTFVAYGISHKLGSLGTGPIVDHLGARKCLPFYLLPLALACGAFAIGAHPVFLLIFMLLSGISIGAGGPVITSLWAEVYGTAHLGAIRSLVTALMVISTSISPILVGLLLDSGANAAEVLYWATGWCAIALVINASVYRGEGRQPALAEEV